MNDENRIIAEMIHSVCREVELEEEFKPYRDFISFEGMPEDYQDMLIKVVVKLKDRGVIK